MSLSLITDYTTLRAAVAGMLHRDSDTAITGNAPLFIQLCEGELYDRLLLRDMETETSLTATIGNNYVALPAGYVSPIALWAIFDSATNIRTLLEPATIEELPYWPNQTYMQFWAIDGDNIRFDTKAAAAYAMPFRYIKSSALSASSTNYLLTRRPDVYLYGALKHAAIFTSDDAALQKYSALMENGINSLKSAEKRNRGIAPLRVDPALVDRSHAFNIYRGN